MNCGVWSVLWMALIGAPPGKWISLPYPMRAGRLCSFWKFLVQTHTLFHSVESTPAVRCALAWISLEYLAFEYSAGCLAKQKSGIHRCPRFCSTHCAIRCSNVSFVAHRFRDWKPVRVGKMLICQALSKYSADRDWIARIPHTLSELKSPLFLASNQTADQVEPANRHTVCIVSLNYVWSNPAGKCIKVCVIDSMTFERLQRLKERFKSYAS